VLVEHAEKNTNLAASILWLGFEREVLPLRKIISDEMMLRYGAMQIDVFSLLAEARQRLNATVTAAEAKRDFWLAQSELTFVVFGGGALAPAIDNARPMAAGEGEGAPH
jgi:outer membrane protein TolC